MSTFENLKITGAGVSRGGQFEQVSLSGSAEITGDVKSLDFRSSGSCKCQGKVEAAESVRISGTAKITGDIKCKVMKASGALSCEGNIEADSVEVSGCAGARELSADNIKIYGALTAESIFGDTVVLHSESKAGFWIFANRYREMSKVQLIECTTLDADYLTADTVRVQNANIGMHCRIKCLEYSETAEIHPEAKVEKVVKI